ncbi:hypothetical protein DV515_00018412 [Chloebia gouldiae]|uniref:Uncharacterized protein n=1 Tax=Chloebia gouldiae TaxID=44316 RepID=A0A3L8Q7U2_CHLGU|nr:hypothetical protein DV515_00018415 [Chloebia gouldiae]RLV63298.1 hypothetical protein DV515_00018412 [Chloebia gouldiae]
MGTVGCCCSWSVMLHPGIAVSMTKEAASSGCASLGLLWVTYPCYSGVPSIPSSAALPRD